MSAVPERDIGPLIWVKAEIDASLGRAGEALSKYAEEKDGAQLKFAATHMHQAQGALAIVGLEGLTLFLQTLENLIGECERGEVEPSPFNLALAQRALTTTRSYLDALADGQPDQPLRLWPMFAELQKARGVEGTNASELFFPDLSLRPPRRPQDYVQPSPEQAARLLRQARALYQKGLLQFLKDGRNGADEMFNAVKTVEACQTTPAGRSFWWAAMGLMDTIASEQGVAEPAVKKLCGRVDQQLRRLIAGLTNVSERLMRDVLFKVAISSTGSELAERVRDTFKLGHVVPEKETTKMQGAPLQPVLRELRDLVLTTKDEWDRFCAGAAVALPKFESHTAVLETEANRLGAQLLVDLAGTVHQAAQWLRKDPLKHSEAVAMEIATTLLLMENAVDNFDRLDEDFHPQATMMVNRLKAMQRGLPLGPLEAPLLDKMSRQAQERLLMRQVVREIQTNLNQIEQVLDNFFRDPGRQGELEGLATPIKQVEGALYILDQPRAVTVLHECGKRIAGFAQGRGSQQDFDEVANRLSALGFFVSALPFGNADIEALLSFDKSDEKEDDEEGSGFVSTVFFNSIEEQLESQKKEARELADALKAAPQDDELREKLQQNLEAIRQDANLAGDVHLEKKAGETLARLESAPADELTLEPVLTPARPDAPLPDAESSRLAASAEEEIDAELLDIFLEEAEEVLGNIAEGLAASRRSPHDHSQLTTIRRGFHTLKGSGRMVNLKDLGETAWAVEQVMNRWLQQELDATPELHAFIDRALVVFKRWIEQLQAGGSTFLDASALVAEAELLKSGDSASPAVVVPAAPAAIEAAPAPEPAPLPDLEETVLTPFVEELSLPELDLPSLDLASSGTGEVAPQEDALALPELAFEQPIQPAIAEEEIPAAALSPADALPTLELDASDTRLSPLEEPNAEEGLPSLEALLDEFAHPVEHRTSAAPAMPELPSLDLDDLDSIDLEDPAEALLEAPPTDLEPLDDLLSLSDEDGLHLIEEVELETQAPEQIRAIELEEQPATTTIQEETLPEPPRPDTVSIGPLSMSRGLYESYLDEALGRIATLRHELSEARLAPFLPPTEASYRAAHTLAGISGTVGVSPLHQLGKAVEHALERLAHAEAPAGEHLDLLDEGSRAIEHMVAAVADLSFPDPVEGLVSRLDSLNPVHHRSELLASLPEVPEIRHPLSPVEPVQAVPEVRTAEPATAPVAALPLVSRIDDDLDEQLLPIFLEESVDLMRGIETASRRWTENPADGEPPKSLARLLHTLKGSARMAGAMGLGEIVHELESRVEQAAAGSAATPAFFEDYHATVDQISQILDRLRGGEAPIAAAAPEAPVAESPAAAGATVDLTDAGAQQQATLRVRADLVDRLVNEAGEMSIARARIEGEMRTLHSSLLDLTENVIRLRKQLREIEIQAESQMQSREAAQGADHGFDPLEFDRFTRFQELTRMMAESVNDVSTIQHNLLRNLEDADAALISQGRINRNLAQSLMSVRMVPFNSLAPRLHRIVRQTAKELGRKVNLDIRGGQVDLDRSVLERIAAPLEHLLRNAINHGIEMPAARAAKGKPELGQITLTLAQEGNEISMQLTDDGSGLDFDRIRQRAIESGLLDADAQPDSAALTEFIFKSGFSTATELTEVAGRGVGMDVVKSETASLGGRIDVSSKAGEGTQFRIYLPLTLAVAQALLVVTGTKVFAIPSVMVEQAREIKPKHLPQLLQDAGVDWMGVRYPYHHMPRLLGDQHTALPTDHNTWLLLLRSGSQRIALHVDALMGNQEIVVKNIGPQLARVPGLSGATVLGDGKVVLILNPVVLAARESTQSARRSATAKAEPVASVATVPKVMVVDDSLTVRKITSRLLEREGYQVVLAKDGVDALETLLETIPEVMLVDIEMPRMDGFDLTRNIRADARLKNIPIIMITSRTADKHRNYAMEIGVNHYLGKPYREDELLALLKQYTGRDELALRA